MPTTGSPSRSERLSDSSESSAFQYVSPLTLFSERQTAHTKFSRALKQRKKTLIYFRQQFKLLPIPPSFSSLAAFSILSFSARWKAGGSDPPTTPPETFMNCHGNKFGKGRHLIVNSHDPFVKGFCQLHNLKKMERDKSGDLPFRDSPYIIHNQNFLNPYVYSSLLLCQNLVLA